jgi:hypothetical protein
MDTTHGDVDSDILVMIRGGGEVTIPPDEIWYPIITGGITNVSLSSKSIA